jgi:hypothetical protein
VLRRGRALLEACGDDCGDDDHDPRKDGEGEVASGIVGAEQEVHEGAFRRAQSSRDGAPCCSRWASLAALARTT